MTNVLICGIGGKMGQHVLECVSSRDDMRVVGGIDKFANAEDFKIPVYKSVFDVKDKVDVIIDFSRPEALADLLKYGTENGVSLVLATTGYTPEQQQAVEEASKKTAVFQSSNMSLGVNLLIELCRKATDFLGDAFEVEIIEQHHNRKVDAPSGTALSIAKAINEEFDNSKEFVYGRHGKDCKRTPKEIGIHAVRGGTIVGKHDVLFIGKDEVITLAHEAQSRMVFAQGAVKAAAFVAQKNQGMYSMKEMLAEIMD